MTGEIWTPLDNVFQFHHLGRLFSSASLCYRSPLVLFAIYHVSVFLDFDASLSRNDISLDNSLVVGYWFSWKVFWRWNVFWGNREAQQCLEYYFSSDFGKDHIVFPAEWVQDAWR